MMGRSPHRNNPLLRFVISVLFWGRGKEEGSGLGTRPQSSPVPPSKQAKKDLGRLVLIGHGILSVSGGGGCFHPRAAHGSGARGRDPPSKPWFGSVIRPVPQSTNPPGFLSWPLRIGDWRGRRGLPNRSGRGQERKQPNAAPSCLASCHAELLLPAGRACWGWGWDAGGWIMDSWIHGWTCCNLRPALGPAVKTRGSTAPVLLPLPPPLSPGPELYQRRLVVGRAI
jgi:hypothetical protein